MNKNNKIILSIIGIAILIVSVVGVTYAFFNYTRTGTANTISVGRISFNHTQDGKIELTNVFPVDKNNLDSTNSDTVTINITGDTTYTEGIEYKVTIEEVNNTINNKEVPISIKATANNLGTEDSNYYTNRENKEKIYTLNSNGVAYNGKYIAVGYIPAGSTGVNGSIDITAFIDTNKVAISDTYDGTENDNMGTTNDWVDGRVVFTTSEWNSFASTALSFKVKVEANEGIWVEQKFLTVKNFSNEQEWKNIRANITSIEFHRDGIAPENPVISFDVTSETSDPEKGTITLYTVDDGLGNNTYKAIVVGNDIIYAPEDCTRLFGNMSNLVSFNSENFKVDNTENLFGLFFNCRKLVNIDSLLSWNTSNVTDISSIFYSCRELTNLNALSNWDVSKVESMNASFLQCWGLLDINGLSNWNVSSATNMGRLFSNTGFSDTSPLENWNVSNVTNMSSMFNNCDISNVDGLINWNVENVTDMISMFNNDSNLYSINALSNWNTKSLQNISIMFSTTNISDLTPLQNWKTDNVLAMGGTFDGCKRVTSLNGLENWNVENVLNYNYSIGVNEYYAFSNMTSLQDASAINNWNINKNANFTNLFKNTPVHPEFTKVAGTWDSNGTFTPNA